MSNCISKGLPDFSMEGKCEQTAEEIE